MDIETIRAQPVLTIAPGFEARPATCADAVALHDLLERNRDRLMRHMPALAALDEIGAVETHLAGLAELRDAGRLLEWHLFADETLIGGVRLNHIDCAHGSASIGYYLDAERQGRGYATTAVRRVLRHAFDVLGVHRIELRCATGNAPSVQLAERIGFAREGLLRGAERLPHGRVDHYVYGLLRDDSAVARLPAPPAPLRIIETKRLRLRPLTLDDAAFIDELVNDPDWLRYIGDRNVHSLDDARRYITDGPMTMYARHGCGLLLVETHAGEPVGLCGLLRRDTLPDPDIGYALHAAHRGRGYAREAAEAVLADGRERLGLRRILATTVPDNDRSVALLELLGLRFESMIQPNGDDRPVKLFAWNRGDD